MDPGCGVGAFERRVGLAGSTVSAGTPEATASTGFALDVQEAVGHTVIAITGELDAFTSQQLRTVLASLDRSQRVVVDVSAMTFIDSSALGVLVGAARRLASNGGRLVVRNPRPPAYGVFELTATLEALGVEQ